MIDNTRLLWVHTEYGKFKVKPSVLKQRCLAAVVHISCSQLASERLRNLKLDHSIIPTSLHQTVGYPLTLIHWRRVGAFPRPLLE